MDKTISRSGEAILRRDDVQLFQTKRRVVVMTQDNIALGSARAVDAFIMLEDVLRPKVDAAKLFVVNFTITAFEFKLQSARLDLTVATVLVV